MAVKQILGKVTVTPKGEYSSGETYKRLDIVTSNGQSYIAKVDNTGVSVTDTNTWLQLVEKPEKGIDYFTEEDIAQLVSMVTDESESEFNEYYNGKVSDFNSNASSKTSEFNSNYETKLSAFNENASTQTSTFNSVVEQATSDFNSNASTLTETFNTNASEKTSAFNTNASEKTQEFNDNVDEKTEQITTQLDNYVQFDNYPSNEKAGVIKPSNNFMVDPSNGYVYAEALDATSYYENTDSTSFISKGTLENIKDDYVESSTPVKNLNNSLKDFTPKNNAEGTDNVFDDGLESPLYALGGDGKSEQVVTTGKQLFDKNNVLSDYRLGSDGIQIVTEGYSLTEFIEVKPSTNYYRNIDITLMECVCLYDVNKTFISRLTSGKGFVTTEDTYYLRTDVATEKLDITMLAEGTTETEYEPYTGGQPSPSPDYPQEINSIEGSVEFACRGKNILTKKSSTQTSNGITNVFKDNTLTYNGTASLNYSNCVPTGNFKITKGTYTFSITNPLDTSISVRFQKTIDYNGGSFEARINKGETSVTFTLHDDFNFLYFYLITREGDTYSGHTSMQLEKGTQATDYEPHVEPNKVTFNLGQEKLRSVGDVKDELVVDLDTGDYYKVENVGEFDYNGLDSSDIRNTTLVTSTIGQNLLAAVFDILNSTPNATNKPTSNKFATKVLGSVSDTENPDNVRFFEGIAHHSTNSQQFIISIEKTRLNSVDLAGFIQYFSNNPVKIQCSLATPTTKKLGTLSAEDLAKLKTFYGYNNVTINTNLGLMNIRFTYGLDIKKYVDNKIAQLSEQLIKGE